MTARVRGPWAPKCGSSGAGGSFNNALSIAMVMSPPGGHWLIPAAPRASASA